MIENKIKTTNKNQTISRQQLKLEKSDIQFTRMYFSIKGERIGRSILLFSQIIMLAVFVINFASLSSFVASKLPVHEIINAFGVADAFFRSMLISLTVLGLLVCLGFVIPLLTARTAQAVNLIAKIVLWVEVPLAIILFITSLFAALYLPVEFNWMGVVFATMNIVLIIVGSIFVISSSKNLVKKIDKAIDDSNNLDEHYSLGYGE
ncbi:hypothetical protein STIUS_v1c02550 [Spiroplasma sp. TIUS-1]|uniref:hypothetical protein n=1 Tax=Spiroplasma sp. TIUS-1 TaxID=216963 RepID=UPI001398E85D|nr:hypothetical protein [Spiroplasma sp. TIUS-1]QHX35809.1 hypothetical protein STIUS_v1c02550 [Spiroplasma sp. TIUS-1]